MNFNRIRRSASGVVAVGIALCLNAALASKAEAATITFAEQQVKGLKSFDVKNGVLSFLPPAISPLTKFRFLNDPNIGLLGPTANGAVIGTLYNATLTITTVPIGSSQLGINSAEIYESGIFEYKPAVGSGLDPTKVLLRTTITTSNVLGGAFALQGAFLGNAGTINATDNTGGPFDPSGSFSVISVQFYSDFLPGVNLPTNVGYDQNMSYSITNFTPPINHFPGPHIVNTKFDAGGRFGITVNDVPEPGTLALLCGLGVSGSLLAVRRRRK